MDFILEGTEGLSEVGGKVHVVQRSLWLLLREGSRGCQLLSPATGALGKLRRAKAERRVEVEERGVQNADKGSEEVRGAVTATASPQHILGVRPLLGSVLRP